MQQNLAQLVQEELAQVDAAEQAWCLPVPHRRRRDATTSSCAMSVDVVGLFPRVRDLASGKDVVKYVMVATALVPDYVTKSHGEDESRPQIKRWRTNFW